MMDFLQFISFGKKSRIVLSGKKEEKINSRTEIIPRKNINIFLFWERLLDQHEHSVHKGTCHQT